MTPTTNIASRRRFRVTTLVSVRRQVLVWAFTIPLLIVASEVALLGWGFSWMSAKQRGVKQIQDKYNNATESFFTANQEFQALVPDIQRLAATPAMVSTRVNMIAATFEIIPEMITEKVLASDVVTLPPMLPKPSGIKIRVRGTPERVHQFFAQLEAEFPGLIVMGMKAEVADHVLAYETTYLIPNYGQLTRSEAN